MDQTQGNYYQYPYYLMPASSPHDATSGSTASLMLPFTHGISISTVDGISSSKLLSTSVDSYIISPTATTTVKPEGQEEKSYNVGVISENSNNGAAIVWF